jgi:hypothetical protein
MAHKHMLLLLLVIKQEGENSVEVRHNFKSSLIIHWHVPHESLDVPVISK